MRDFPWAVDCVCFDGWDNADTGSATSAYWLAAKSQRCQFAPICFFRGPIPSASLERSLLSAAMEASTGFPRYVSHDRDLNRVALDDFSSVDDLSPFHAEGKSGGNPCTSRGNILF